VKDANFQFAAHEEDMRHWLCKLDTDIDFKRLARSIGDPAEVERQAVESMREQIALGMKGQLVASDCQFGRTLQWLNLPPGIYESRLTLETKEGVIGQTVELSLLQANSMLQVTEVTENAIQFDGELLGDLRHKSSCFLSQQGLWSSP